MPEKAIKPKFKTLWQNLSPINYEDIIVTKLSNYKPVDIVYINGVQTIIAIKGKSLYFLDTIAFEETRKPIKFFNKSFSICYDLYYTEIINIDGEMHFIAEISRTEEHKRYLIMVNITKEDIFEYKSDCINKIVLAQIDGTPHILVDEVARISNGYNEVELNKWDIKNGKIIDTFRFSYSRRNYDNYPKLTVFDEIVRISSTCQIFLDIRTFKTINTFEDYVFEGYYYENYLDFKLNDKWITITSGGRKDEPLNRNYIWDTLTGEKIAELPGNGDPQNTAGYIMKISYNQVGNPLLILSEYLNHRTIVYNLDKIDKGFQYFKDVNNCAYSLGNIIPVTLDRKPILIETRYSGTGGRAWSLDTFEPVEGLSFHEALYGDSHDMDKLYPLTLPNGMDAFMVENNLNNTPIWNPHGKARHYTYTHHIENAVVNGKEIFVTASEDRVIRLYDTLSGKLMLESSPINHEIIHLTIAQSKDKSVAIVGLKDYTVQLYDLSNLQPTGVTINIGEIYGELLIAKFEGKTQLLASTQCNRVCSWDIETGKPIHQPLNILQPLDKGEEPTLICDLGDIITNLIQLSGNPVLAVTLLGCDGTFLWDLNSNKNLGTLIFDKTMMRHADEYTCLYDITKISVIIENGKEKLLTGSMTGRLVNFDPTTLERTSPRIIKTIDSENNLIDLIDLKPLSTDNYCLAIALIDHKLKIYDLETSKIMKTIEMEQPITAFTISNNKLIICYSENIKAIEIKM